METDWEALYQANDTRWDKGEPSPGLVDFLRDHPDLENGTVLVPGCGAGHDVREWARHGFHVTGLDIAPGAIRRCEGHEPPDQGTASYLLGDFLNDAPHVSFDYVFEHTFYCAIPVTKRSDYLNALRRWLKPSGHFVAVHYFLEEEDGPPHGTTRDEVIDRFSDHFELIHDWVPRSYPNRTHLERMFWWNHKAR